MLTPACTSLDLLQAPLVRPDYVLNVVKSKKAKRTPPKPSASPRPYPSASTSGTRKRPRPSESSQTAVSQTGSGGSAFKVSKRRCLSCRL